MVKTTTRMWLLGAWFAAGAVSVAWSVNLGASLSTSALLVALGVAPAIVMLLIDAGAPSPSVAEILRSVNAEDGDVR